MSLWKKVLLTHMRRNQIEKVFTIGDPEGSIYNVVYHHLRESVPNLGGAPVWNCTRRALENVLVRGPLGVVMDPCTVEYDERDFIQHMSSDKATFHKIGLYIMADTLDRSVELPKDCMILCKYDEWDGETISSVTNYSRVDNTEKWCLKTRGLQWSKPYKKNLKGESTHPTHDEFKDIITESLSHAGLLGPSQNVGCFSPVRSLFTFLPVPIDKQHPRSCGSCGEIHRCSQVYSTRYTI